MPSIRTEEAQLGKSKLEELIKNAGYESIRQFCIDADIDQSNLYTNIDGKWGMSVKRMFKIANLLGVHINQILEIFYPKEYAENQNLL